MPVSNKPWRLSFSAASVESTSGRQDVGHWCVDHLMKQPEERPRGQTRRQAEGEDEAGEDEQEEDEIGQIRPG